MTAAREMTRAATSAAMTAWSTVSVWRTARRRPAVAEAEAEAEATALLAEGVGSPVMPLALARATRSGMVVSYEGQSGSAEGGWRRTLRKLWI